MKSAVQLRIVEDPAAVELAAATPLPAPEPAPWNVDTRIRIPMDAWIYHDAKGYKFLTSFDCPDLPLDDVTHEIQFYLEKLNMTLSCMTPESA